MQKNLLNNAHINNEQTLIIPEELKRKFPLNINKKEQITDSRKIITNIITRKDHRLLVVCGPCSIHDTEAAIDYAKRLKVLSLHLQDYLYIVMRVYFEKPRTTIGWKGLINDPYIDNSFKIEDGLHIARKLLINLVELGLPLATEVLDPYNPQYLGDLFSLASIGARTTESQTHREIASGLSIPVGFKNSTDGNFNTAINAMCASAMPHYFMSINQLGKVCLLKTQGNLNTYIILRGAKTYSNYEINHVYQCEQEMIKHGLQPAIMIDCSHGNSNKDYRFQSNVTKSIISQINNGNRSIIGLMLESNINEGKQSSEKPRTSMKYGVSITDACINWNFTEAVLYDIKEGIKEILLSRLS